MASAWGLSWGAAWGNAWGVISADIPDPGADGGGPYKKRSKKDEEERKRKARYYADLVYQQWIDRINEQAKQAENARIAQEKADALAREREELARIAGNEAQRLEKSYGIVLNSQIESLNKLIAKKEDDLVFTMAIMLASD